MQGRQVSLAPRAPQGPSEWLGLRERGATRVQPDLRVRQGQREPLERRGRKGPKGRLANSVRQALLAPPAPRGRRAM